MATTLPNLEKVTVCMDRRRGREEEIINIVLFSIDGDGNGEVIFYFVWIEGRGKERIKL